MINDANVIYILSGLLLSAVIVLIILIRSTLSRRGGWGINFNKSTYVCPACNEKLPVVRKPKNLRQVLWGGWTCQNCGVEVNKWGEFLNKEKTT